MGHHRIVTLLEADNGNRFGNRWQTLSTWLLTADYSNLPSETRQIMKPESKFPAIPALKPSNQIKQ